MYQLYEQSDGAALRGSLGALRHPIGEAARAALRRDVCEYVEKLRGDGWPPERVIVAVKHLARESGLYPTSQVTLSGVLLDDADALLVDIVGWCIERYYFRPERV